MYAKLIFKNAKRSVKDYLIYIVTMTLCVTLFYAFLSISSTHYHPTIGAEYNISLLAGGMKLAICGSRIVQAEQERQAAEQADTRRNLLGSGDRSC